MKRVGQLETAVFVMLGGCCPIGKLVFHVFAGLLSSNAISFACGPLLGLRRLVLVGAKVADRESSSPKS
jgi:hypothetical protein